MQRRYGFAAGFCRRPCRSLPPDMKSYWMTGNKTCGKIRAPAPRFFFVWTWPLATEQQSRTCREVFCEKPPRIRFSGRTAVPPAYTFPGGVTCVVFRTNCPIADTTPVRLACDMSCGRKAKAACASGRFAGKTPRIRFSERTAVPPLAAVALSGGHFAKGLYRLLTVKLRFPGGLRGFVAENVPECRLIFLCENPDLLFLLWWGKGAPFSGERDGFAPFRAVFRGLVEMWLRAGC